MRRNRQANCILSVLLALALTASALPMSAQAASSSEIQKEIDALEEKNAAIQKEINAIQRQYDANYSDMQAMVEQKSAIDQEMTLLSDKIETTTSRIYATVCIYIPCCKNIMYIIKSSFNIRPVEVLSPYRMAV